MIVEVVGIDGAGKSTLVNGLAARINGEARKTNAFPGDVHARASAVGTELGTRAEAAFRALAVASALLAEAATPAGRLLVYDRFVEGARMFFAVKQCHPLPEDVLATLPTPEAVLLVDVPVSLGLRRRARPSEDSATSERAYLQACADYLHERAARQGWTVIDGTEPVDRVLDVAVASLSRLTA